MTINLPKNIEWQFLHPSSTIKSSRARQCKTMSKEKQREEGNREFGRQSFRFPEEKRGFQWLQLFRRSSSPRLSYSRGTVADTRAKVFEVGLKLAYHREGRWGECLPDTVSSTYSRVIRWNLWSTTTRGWTSSSSPYSKAFPHRILR